jgi:plastocyanin
MNSRNPLAGRLLAACLLASLAAATPTVAANHVITQSGFAFSPGDIQINVGDSVQWVWTGGFHTVTNGLNLSDPALATLFDAPLDSAHPTFSHTFTSPGTVPFFCRPHLLIGMTGSVTVLAASSVDQVPARGGLALAGAPNPFNPRTVITYALPEAAGVRLSVFDMAGRLVRVLADGGTRDAGLHETTWDGVGDDGREAAAGVYVVTVEAAGLRESIKLTLAK